MATVDKYTTATNAFNEAKATLDTINNTIQQDILHQNKITQDNVKTMETNFMKFFNIIGNINGVDDLTIGGKNKKYKKQKGGDENLELRLEAATDALNKITTIVNTLNEDEDYLKGSWLDIKTKLEKQKTLLDSIFYQLKEAVGTNGLQLSPEASSGVVKKNMGGKSKNKTNKKNQRGGMYAASIPTDQYSNSSSLLAGAADPYSQATAFNAAIYAPQAFNAGLALPPLVSSELPPIYTNVTTPLLSSNTVMSPPQVASVSTRQNGGTNRSKKTKQNGGDISVPASNYSVNEMNMPVTDTPNYNIVSSMQPKQNGGRKKKQNNKKN